jgi:predicted Zn-dependent protease
MNRRIRWLAIFLAPLFAVLGIIVFVFGLAAELLTERQQFANLLSPSMQIAAAGLCLAGTMFLFWFIVVGWLLVRQSRQLGSGYGDAYRLIESFRFREAIPLLERSIKEGKETAEVLMLLTSAYAYAGKLGKAQDTADRAVRLFPEDPGSYITLANGYRLQAAYDEAARALMRAAELQPDLPVIWAELGLTQQMAGDAAALDSFRRAAQSALPPMYGVRVYYHLAQACAAQGDAAQAMSATAKMMAAREGLATWQSGLAALEGTAYGQALRRELDAIQQALAEADASKLG